MKGAKSTFCYKHITLAGPIIATSFL